MAGEGVGSAAGCGLRAAGCGLRAAGRRRTASGKRQATNDAWRITLAA
ncbi:conserved hypothetical protein [Burkholderia pseudomallei 1106a]|uniref:Uncharacterized protein n=1 Tax=Burkholderia pseudomallei (strain 1106a) TaxID=357348 RepID=A3NZC7_BURP0|nr:conserved hypothetical protein [Burkholderia pseudomallei 1106a]